MAAFQSNVAHNGVPEKAIDGNMDSTYNNGFCTHTSDLPAPWLTVDYGHLVDVNSVQLFNRKDCYCK